jgi:hypothetical protein
MKRIVPSTIAAVALLGAGSALAQPRGADHRPPAPQHGPQQPGPQHPAAKPAHNSWDKPQARKGQGWNRHVRACKAKYRSYSPQRDAYRSNRGAWVRCRL